MRLDNTAYFVLTQKSSTPIGYDSFGRPVYGTVTTYEPFASVIEPYSSTLAQTKYGLTIDVQYRLFVKPDSRFVLTQKIKFSPTASEVFSITGCMKYPRHYEVLIKKELS